MTATGASFARGASKQDYGTPRVFLDAVEKRFGKLVTDLAATVDNCVAPRKPGLMLAFYGPGSGHGEDSLAQDWTKLRGNLWLNPPFDQIAPWAKKCALTATAPMGKDLRHIFFLVPASVGANWYAEHVHQKAQVLFLSPRLSFDGKNPYPKDCMLACYGLKPGYECWRWQP